MTWLPSLLFILLIISVLLNVAQHMDIQDLRHGISSTDEQCSAVDIAEDARPYGKCLGCNRLRRVSAERCDECSGEVRPWNVA